MVLLLWFFVVFLSRLFLFFYMPDHLYVCVCMLGLLPVFFFFVIHTSNIGICLATNRYELNRPLFSNCPLI